VNTANKEATDSSTATHRLGATVAVWAGVSAFAVVWVNFAGAKDFIPEDYVLE
jgi:hypothetical protein